MKKLEIGHNSGYSYNVGQNWIIPNENGFSNTIDFIHLNYVEENGTKYSGCVLVWKRWNGYEFNEDQENYFSESFEGIINMAKSYLINLYDPFEVLKLSISENINKNVSDMAHKMDLRIAQFRGYLFEQQLILKGI